MKLNKMLVAVVGLLVAASMAMAEIDTSDHTYKGKINFDTPACDIRIGNVKMTATADELNIMDGVTATADELNIMDGVTATYDEINMAADASSYGVGTVSNVSSSVTETLGQVKKTVITITNCVLIAADGGDKGENKPLYRFPEGWFTILSTASDITQVQSLDTATNIYIAVGTAACADDSTLTGTEVDILPAVLVADAEYSRTNSVQTGLASPANFDGTTTPKTIWLNMAVDDDTTAAASTNTFTGTLTIFWVPGEDY